MFSLPLNIYIMIALVLVAFLAIALIYIFAYRLPWDGDFPKLAVICFAVAGAVIFLFGACDRLFLNGKIFNMDVVQLTVAALVGYLGITWEALARYLKYFGIDIKKRNNLKKPK